jgi:hypothetical protein
MLQRKIALLLMTVLILALSSLICADITIVQNYHVGTTNGQPAKDTARSIYIGSNCVLQQINSDINVLYNSTSGKMYYIDTVKKEYSILDYNKVKPILDSMAGMFADMIVKIIPTNEKVIVGKWNTNKWKLTVTSSVVNIDMNMHFTELIRMPEFYTDFESKFSDLRLGWKEVTKQMQKIKGFNVLSAGKVTQSGKSFDLSIEVVEFSEKPLPANLFEIPKDYKNVEFQPVNLQKFN